MKKGPTYEQQRAYVIKTIRDFIEGTGGPYDWDGFISERVGYAELDAMQEFCLQLPTVYPPAGKAGGWCSSEGLEALRKKLEQLEAADARDE